MPWYCYRCPECDERWAVLNQPNPDHEWCPRGCQPETDAGDPIRDYRAERASVNIANLRKDRETK